MSEGILTGITNHSSPSASQPAITARVTWEGSQLQVPVLLDSWSDANFICPTLVRRLGIPTVPLARPLRPCALTGAQLEEVHRDTTPVKILVSGNHQEEMVAYHWCWEGHGCVNTTPRWTGVGDSSQTGVLAVTLHAAEPFSATQPKTTAPPNLSSEPAEYHDLGEVFSKSRATSLTPHRFYDCAIDLFSGTSPPRGRLFSLSAPECLAMKKYIGESLVASLIRPSSSPAGAGFIFVGKKDGPLRPCIDYRGLNDITVKKRYPIPLISSAFATLQNWIYGTHTTLSA